MSLIDLKAETKSNAHGFLFEATRVAGPEPMDRPNRIMLDSDTPRAKLR